MKYQIDNLKVAPQELRNIRNLIESKYKIKNFTYKILAKSIDARIKTAIVVIFKIMIETDETPIGKNLSFYKEVKKELEYPKWQGQAPVIVGFGPAGMFAALYLARCKANPIIIERGSRIEERQKEVEAFLKTRVLNPESNVQFGEGGAGAFSDGKLVTNVKDELISFIINEFYLHGAKEDILYESKPHIGTDYLATIVKNIREEIISLGGEFHFNTCLTNVEALKGEIKCYFKEKLEPINTKHLLLCLGHSARDTIKALYLNLGLAMEPKAFSMGVRVEHPRKQIDEAQYGWFAKYLPAAYYNLATHHNQRGIYTFCMCPGGYVIASQSEANTIVTNGMSDNARDNFNSNSALLVEVNPNDFYHHSPLDGLDYQEKYEKLAFEISNDYQAPANLFKEFLENKVAKQFRSVTTTYPHGLVFADLRKCLPDYIVKELKYGIMEFDHKIKGFNNPDAIMIGIESRSSSPVRILRDENKEANVKGIYPVGEGAGYAGGITSAALDGLKTAISIVRRINNV